MLHPFDFAQDRQPRNKIAGLNIVDSRLRGNDRWTSNITFYLICQTIDIGGFGAVMVKKTRDEGRLKIHEGYTYSIPYESAPNRPLSQTAPRRKRRG
jgi:hypothetical protein